MDTAVLHANRLHKTMFIQQVSPSLNVGKEPLYIGHLLY